MIIVFVVFYFIDVEDVNFVINFDYPNSSEDYIHRIGRTGRSQRSGTAYAFFTPNNARQARDLISVLREANQVVNPKLSEFAAQSRGNFNNSRGKFLDIKIVVLFFFFIVEVIFMQLTKL
jgi:superfamily II DNA/RNA helicase